MAGVRIGPGRTALALLSVLAPWVAASAQTTAETSVDRAPAPVSIPPTPPGTQIETRPPPAKAVLLGELESQLVEVAEPGDLEGCDAPVREQYREVRADIDEAMQHPEMLAKKVGRAWAQLGMWAHAYRIPGMALAAYHNARILSPRDRRWAYYEALLNQSLGRLDEAREGFTRAHETRPEDLQTLLRLAELEIESGRLDEALEWARKALRVEPQSAHALLLQGQVALLRGQYDEAIAHLRDAMRERPDSNRVRYALALALRGVGEAGRAERLLGAFARTERRGERRLTNDLLVTRLEAMNIGSKRWMRLGQAALRMGRNERALSLYERAVEAAPERVAARDALGSVLLAVGRVQEALEQYEWVAQHAPESASSWYGLGVAYERAGRTEDAIAALEHAVQLAEDSAQSQFKLGSLLAGAGRESDALAAYARAIELEPWRAHFRLERATLLISLGRYSEAANALDADLKALPDSPGLHLMRARLLASSPDGTQRDGARSLEMAQIGAERYTVLSAETLAMAYAETGDFQNAVAWQKAALEAAQSHDETAQFMTWVGRRLELYEKHEPCREPWFAGESFAAGVRVSPPSG